MSSKINGLNGPSSPVGARGGAHPTSGAAGADTAGASPSARSADSEVQITGSASLLASVAQQLQGMPSIDEARVAQFRTAIDNGSYTVQPGAVADHLMQLEQSLAQISGG
jgi:negative regulator of flagellin synthesis FlgM